MKLALAVLAATAYVVLSLVGGSTEVMAEARVSGIVHDADGNSVAHAYIEAVPVLAKSGGGTVGSVPNPWIAADSHGSFTVSLAPGRYRIRAKDEVDGYPDPSFWINLDPEARFPEITVGDEKVEGIEVVLGKQGGILSGEIRDDKSREFLVGVKIRIQDAKNPAAYVEVFTNRDGHFQYTIASKPVLISASAQGYRPLGLERGAEITILPGEQREFQLEMGHE